MKRPYSELSTTHRADGEEEEEEEETDRFDERGGGSATSITVTTTATTAAQGAAAEGEATTTTTSTTAPLPGKNSSSGGDNNVSAVTTTSRDITVARNVLNIDHEPQYRSSSSSPTAPVTSTTIATVATTATTTDAIDDTTVLTPPPSPPPTTTFHEASPSPQQQQQQQQQQHPKVLGFHVFSTKRSMKRQRSVATLNETTITTIDSETTLMDAGTRSTNSSNNISCTEDSSDTKNIITTAATTEDSPIVIEVLPLSVLQRIYEHIPLPPILPVTDDELVRYTMISVNAIRNSDVVQLRHILLQHPPILPSSNASHHHHHHPQYENSTTPISLSWFDGRNRNGESLLHLACRRSTVDVVKFLIDEAQVNVFVTDLCGRTCLHDICWRPRVEESIPIFHVVRQYYMTSVQTQRLEEQRERALHPSNTHSNSNSNQNSNNNNPDTIPSVEIINDDIDDSNTAVAVVKTPTVKSPVVPSGTGMKLKSSYMQWLSMWPFQPDIRGHVCFDYCRQEHWYEWNKYLEEQIQNDMMMKASTAASNTAMMTMTDLQERILSSSNPNSKTTLVDDETTEERKLPSPRIKVQEVVEQEDKSPTWCIIG